MPLPTPLSLALHAGMVIPATPLALNANRTLDERRQRALFRYYAEAGVGGIAVGVHTTQFAIRDPHVGLFEPLLALTQEELNRLDVGRHTPLLRISGVCGDTEHAVREAEIARDLGFHAGLLSLAALRDAPIERLIDHCNAVAQEIPLIGFYLQPSVGGRVLDIAFWRRFAEIENVIAVKIAPFNRYQTLEVVRAFAEAGREDVALYTGNDDNIVLDLLTPYRFQVAGKVVERRIVGGLLGHWSVWTRQAVTILEECRAVTKSGGAVSSELLRKSVEVTDCNAAFFDSTNGFKGCIAGLHEVLRRQGLLEGIWCLDPNEGLSTGQKEEIDRVYHAYPHLNDDAIVAENLDRWLS